MSSRLLSFLALALLLATWLEFALGIVAPTLAPDPATGRVWGTSAGWVAARLGWEGRGAIIYDFDAFGRASHLLGAHHDVFEPNLPPAALLHLPLAPLDAGTALAGWTIFSLACFLAAWLGLLVAVRMPLAAALVLTALVPLFQPWRENIAAGHAYALVLLLTVLGAWGLAAQARRAKAGGLKGAAGDLLAGLALGLLCVVRLYYGVVLLLPALLQRRRTALSVAAMLLGAASLLALVWWQPRVWTTDVQLLLSWRQRPETVVVGYQSLYSFILRLFHYDARFNPQPPMPLPWLVEPAWWALALVLLGVSLLIGWRARAASGRAASQQLMLPALSVPLALLLAPTSVEYHYTLALFPLLVVLALLWHTRGPLAAWLVLGTAALLLGAPWGYNVPGVAGWATLLHYPRLYGVMLLWLLIVLRLRRAQISAPPSTAHNSSESGR